MEAPADPQQESKSEYDRQREEFFEQMRATAERANLSGEAGERRVAEAIAAARARKVKREPPSATR